LIHCGSCLAILPTLEACSVDSVVCDPPYGLSFMGKDWDHGVPGEAYWREVLRVAKPGAHLLAFGGTRTYHRLTCAIEDAGWEIRDCVMWVYGSGFPKSHDISKAIDREAGAEREVVGPKVYADGTVGTWRKSASDKYAQDEWTTDNSDRPKHITAPATPEAAQWQGWGTALKPAWEPIIVARKPLEGTVAGNVLKWGTGGINVDGCRVHGGPSEGGSVSGSTAMGQSSGWNAHENRTTEIDRSMASGRWPANLIHDGSEEVVGLFPETKSQKANTVRRSNGVLKHGGQNGRPSHGTFDRVTTEEGYTDSGSAARFFYCPKSSKRDRDDGCEGLEEREPCHAYGSGMNTATKVRTHEQEANGVTREPRRNHHPTVKPTDLMRYLCRLVTPPGGLVLDPFAGSGSTGKAAMLEGFRFVGIELDPDHCEIARRRIEHARQSMGLFA
jgi:DNA modification methylase